MDQFHLTEIVLAQARLLGAVNPRIWWCDDERNLRTMKIALKDGRRIEDLEVMLVVAENWPTADEHWAIAGVKGHERCMLLHAMAISMAHAARGCKCSGGVACPAGLIALGEPCSPERATVDGGFELNDDERARYKASLSG